MTRQIPLPLPHVSAMGADDFLITASNRDAAAWIDKWPHWPSHGLVVAGSSGSGKTHLLHLWLTKSGGTLVDHAALLSQDSAALTAITKAIAIDDADFVAGKRDGEEKLFHLYNHIKEIGGWLFVTMRQGVGQAHFVLPDLRSRLLALPAVTLGAPDDELLSALIVKQFSDRQVTLDAGVVTYLVPRVTRDAAGIRDLVERLDKASLAEGRKITVALARKVLEAAHG